MNEINLPPLPERRRQMLCTKCGYQNPETEAATPHAPCENSNCQYLAFVTEADFTAEQFRAGQIAAVEKDRAERVRVPASWLEFVERVSKQTPEKPDYWSSCGQCDHNIADAEELLAAAPPPQPVQESGACAMCGAWQDDQISHHQV